MSVLMADVETCGIETTKKEITFALVWKILMDAHCKLRSQRSH